MDADNSSMSLTNHYICPCCQSDKYVASLRRDGGSTLYCLACGETAGTWDNPTYTVDTSLKPTLRGTSYQPSNQPTLW